MSKRWSAKESTLWPWQGCARIQRLWFWGEVSRAGEECGQLHALSGRLPVHFHCSGYKSDLGSSPTLWPLLLVFTSIETELLTPTSENHSENEMKMGVKCMCQHQTLASESQFPSFFHTVSVSFFPPSSWASCPRSSRACTNQTRFYQLLVPKSMKHRGGALCAASGRRKGKGLLGRSSYKQNG